MSESFIRVNGFSAGSGVSEPISARTVIGLQLARKRSNEVETAAGVTQ